MNNPKLSPPQSASNWPNWLGVLIFLAFIIAVQWLVDWRTVLQDWSQVSWKALLPALLFILVSYAARTWRLIDFFPQPLAQQPKRAANLSLLDHLFNHLGLPRHPKTDFPARMHDTAKIAYLDSQSASLWFRLLDLHTLLCFLIYPVFAITPLRRLSFIIIALWLLVPLVIYLLRHRLQTHFVGQDSTFSILAQKTLTGLPNRFLAFLKSWGITWLVWGFYLTGLVWFARELVPNHSFNVLLMALVAGELALFIPLILPLRMPLYEAGVIVALSAFTGWQIALSTGLNVHFFSLAVALLGGLIGWLLSTKAQQPTDLTNV